MMSDLTWTNEKRRLSQLVPWPRNPRQIKKGEATRLSESLKEFGQPETFAIGPSNEVYNGHQRLQTWFNDFGDFEVDVRVASRPLTEREREKLTVFLHVGTIGQFDWEDLAGWDTSALQEWGFDAETLQGWNLDATNLREMLQAGGNDEAALWEGMPEFEQKDKMAYRSIIMHFNDQQAVDDFAVLVGQGITDKTRYLYYPKQERENLKAYSVQDES